MTSDSKWLKTETMTSPMDDSATSNHTGRSEVGDLREAAGTEFANKQLVYSKISGIGGNQGNIGNSNFKSVGPSTMEENNKFPFSAMIQVNPCFEEDLDDVDLNDPRKRKRALALHDSITAHADSIKDGDNQGDAMEYQHFLTADPGFRGCRE